MKSFQKLFFSLLILLTTENCFSAACCGGGFAAPSLISGDDKAQISTTLSSTQIIVDHVDATGVWRTTDAHQAIKTFKLDAAHIFSDRWQAGVSVPILQRDVDSKTYSGLGDVGLSLGYEYLPEWSYHPYKPKGLGFLQLILPTGKSRVESEVGGRDSRGNGFWAIGMGTLFTKTWSQWDAFYSIDIHRAFNKEVSNSQFSGKLIPAWGGQTSLGAGINISEYRIGSSISWTYEDPIKMEFQTGEITQGSLERYATASLGLSYLANDNWAGTFSFADQTIFGSPQNTSLGRTVSFVLQRKWGR